MGCSEEAALRRTTARNSTGGIRPNDSCGRRWLHRRSQSALIWRNACRNSKPSQGFKAVSSWMKPITPQATGRHVLRIYKCYGWRIVAHEDGDCFMPKNKTKGVACHDREFPGRPEVRACLGDLGPAAILLVAGLIGSLLASLSGAKDSGQYLVIAPPWSNFSQTVNLIAAADGGLVSPGQFQNIAIAASTRAGFSGRALDAWAWFVLPSPQATSCFSVQTATSPQ